LKAYRWRYKIFSLNLYKHPIKQSRREIKINKGKKGKKEMIAFFMAENLSGAFSSPYSSVTP